jgi:hypothetical protein
MSKPIDAHITQTPRNDPKDGNTYIITHYDWRTHYLTVTDIMGGHQQEVPFKDWIKWEYADEA